MFATYSWRVLAWCIELLPKTKIMQVLMIAVAKSRAQKMRKMRKMTMDHG